MRKQIALLAQIQKMDQDLENLKQQIQDGPGRIQEYQREIEGLEEQLETEKNLIQENRKLQRQYEIEVEDGVERIRSSKARLLTIKNNKEYQAVLKEIEETDKIIKNKEDKILRCMEATEELNSMLDEKGQALSITKNRVEKEIMTIRAEVDRAQRLMAEQERRREKVAGVVDVAILAKYERLKMTRGGIAVSQVMNATCSECNMNIPPQMYNELQSGDTLQFCPHCERIIYWNNGNGQPV